MSKTNNSVSAGVGFLGMLTIVFITLKLIGTIAWSWWYVLAPLWAPVALVVAIIIIALIIKLMIK